jgi:hypothetical protein
MSQQQKLLLLLLQLLLLLLLLTAMQLLKTTPHLYNIWTKYCMSVGLKNPECLWLFVPITHSLKNKLCLNTAIFMLIPPGWLRCNNNINKRAGLYKALARISITEKDVFHNYCMCSMGLLSITRQMLLLSCLHWSLLQYLSLHNNEAAVTWTQFKFTRNRVNYVCVCVCVCVCHSSHKYHWLSTIKQNK